MKNERSNKTWMIRCDGGRLYDDFREQKIVAIGWSDIAADVKPGMSRKDIGKLSAQIHPDFTPNEISAGAGQVYRFLSKIQTGDFVVTYSPDNRTYLFGTVQGEASYRADTAPQGLALVRPVHWMPVEIQRDLLSQQAKNSLGSTMSVFAVSDTSAGELAAIANGKLPQKNIAANHRETSEDDDGEFSEISPNPLSEAPQRALEAIKDKLAKLSWDEMQELVAGILRAMGYKTQVSPAGPDRGADIMASPDGFGFEKPRIVVEVKHRDGQMGSAEIRSFLGGRHEDDRGLYVSTGGFTKDAKYEADRARTTVPLTLWTMDTLVRALIDHYDKTDAETKRLIPLKRLYIPA